jgi:hypothetical protein
MLRSHESTTGNDDSQPHYVPPEERDNSATTKEVVMEFDPWLADANPWLADAVTDNEECMTKQSILALFVSALPVSIVSILLWIKRHASSMAITSYIGISATASFIFIASRGNSYDMDDFYQWWLSIAGAMFVMVLVDLLSCKRKIAQSPLHWGINFGSLVFFVGMIMVTGIFDLGGVWSWLVFNALALVPLGIVGLATNQAFLLVLCATGWLMDSFKFADWVSATLFNDEVPIQFIILAISGLLIAGAGWLLSKHQEEVHNFLCYQFEIRSISRKIFPGTSDHVAAQTEEDGLLSSGPNSQVQRIGGDAC